MKLKGATLTVREVYTIELRRLKEPLKVKLASTPFGINADYDAIFPKPSAPFTTHVVKGAAPEKVYDYTNGDFVKEFDEYQRLKNIYVFYRVISDAKSDMTFDTDVRTKSDLLKVADEIREAGFSDGDIQKVNKAAAAAANITDEDIKQAEGSF